MLSADVTSSWMAARLVAGFVFAALRLEAAVSPRGMEREPIRMV